MALIARVTQLSGEIRQPHSSSTKVAPAQRHGGEQMGIQIDRQKRIV
ncbi:hypothetical protein [Nitrosomonas sp. Is79A3]